MTPVVSASRAAASMTASSFIERFYEVLATHPTKALTTEVHTNTLVPTDGKALGNLVALARSALREHGTKPTDRVVFVANNSTRWVALDLAILGEGAIAVPLYARQAPSELAGMIVDCAPTLVVAENQALADALAPHLSASSSPLVPVLLDSLFTATRTPVTDPPQPRQPTDLVTIIYTSGTSGEPKGVTYSVSNVDYMLPVIRDAIQSMLGANSTQDRVFHYLPFCFAGSRMVLWMTLYRASGILLSTDLNKLVDEMKAARPNYYLNVPFLLERVRNGVEKKLTEKPAPIRLLWKKAKAAYARSLIGQATLLDKAILSLSERLVFRVIKAQIGPDLICLICGSAALPEDTQRWFEMLGLPVYQVYGLTETTAIVTMDKPDATLTRRLGKVGWPIPGVELRLGAEDELQVRGANIFPGYWNRDAATAETQTPDGWFRTGDQAELDASFSLKLIGRVKNVLVPQSGHNVAPEPIEEKLLRLPGVEQAVVFGHARPHLVAVLTGDNLDKAVLNKDLEAINADLPFYKRIRDVHLTADRLTPENGCLTANQKLKRKAIERYFAPHLDTLYKSS